LDWSGFPDVAAIGLLICAFASVSRHSHTPVSGFWLTGWLLILLHFVAALFWNLPGVWGELSFILLSASLAGAGILYMHASIPYRNSPSSHWMLGSLLTANTLYITAMCFAPDGHWTLTVTAALLGLCPLAVMLASVRRVNHPLRWVIAVLYGALSIFLLIFQNRPGNGSDLAWNAVMFTVYLGCCIFACYAFGRATAGAFVTIAGFFSWATVFVAAPLMNAYEPLVHVDREAWNLPKYVVAVGMMLLLLEDQLEHNKHLALHDVLTGLPNRRLFQDRMTSAIERSRRSGAEMALLVMDLDGFKQVNDTKGHHVGDLVLQRVAKLFAERARRSDTLSRTGGDEFSLILEEPVSRANAEFVAESLRQMLKEPLDLEGQKVRIGASIGIAIFPEDATDAESLCIAADLNMYDVKNRSRKANQYAQPAKRKSSPARESAIKETLRLSQPSIDPCNES